MRRRLAAFACALAAPACFLAEADAATRFVVKGAGYGHGVGMSQYGAYGFARQGRTYDQILRHYYTGTEVSTLTGSPAVTVLLKSGTTAFSGADRIGDRPLDPTETYSVKADDARVILRSPTGRDMVAFDGPVRAGGPDALRVAGRAAFGVTDGSFRGELEFRPSGGRLLVINALGLDDYVRGVVAGESPPSWPAEALKAQAVAARTYAITSNAGGAEGFTQWSDTRSQVYRGVAGETPTTDAAVAATSRQVVTYLGRPVTTFFFSTSGGRTENVENSFMGATPRPWLKSVEDPFDNASPRHRWGPLRFTRKQAEARLRGYVRGTLKTIRVTRRGVSPRIVSAQIVGTRGTTTVSGPTLRTRFGLYDTWATFTRIGTTIRPPASAVPAPPVPGPPPAEPQPSADPSGGIPFGAASFRAGPLPGARRSAGVISGQVDRARAGQWLRILRRTERGTYRTAFEVQAGPRGRFSATLPGPGTYKVRWNGIDGPTVRAR